MVQGVNKMVELTKIVDVEGIEKKMDELRRLIDQNLPQDYSDFLQQYNVCKPNKRSFSFIDRRSKKEETIISFFLGFSGDDYEDIRWAFNNYVTSERIPVGYIPIACDEGGGIICLKLENGEIFFWDSEIEQLIDDPEENIYPIGHNIKEFLDSLF